MALRRQRFATLQLPERHYSENASSWQVRKYAHNTRSVGDLRKRFHYAEAGLDENIVRQRRSAASIWTPRPAP
jgi:hypothetical protein